MIRCCSPEAMFHVEMRALMQRLEWERYENRLHHEPKLEDELPETIVLGEE